MNQYAQSDDLNLQMKFQRNKDCLMGWEDCLIHSAPTKKTASIDLYKGLYWDNHLVSLEL
jgi:hypothetical protein